MKNFKKTEQGIIKYIVLIVIALVLIAYFRSDIQRLWNSPEVKNALLTAIGWMQQALLWVVGKLGWTSSQIK